MVARKKNEKRMLPVVSAMTPTTRGPKNELDCKRGWVSTCVGVWVEGLTLSVIEYRPYLSSVLDER